MINIYFQVRQNNSIHPYRSYQSNLSETALKEIIKTLKCEKTDFFLLSKYAEMGFDLGIYLTFDLDYQSYSDVFGQYFKFIKMEKKFQQLKSFI